MNRLNDHRAHAKQSGGDRGAKAGVDRGAGDAARPVAVVVGAHLAGIEARLDSNGVRTASDVQQNKVKGMCAGGIQNEIDLFVSASVGDEASRGDDLSQRSGELLDSGVKDDSVSFRIRLGRSRKTGKS